MPKSDISYYTSKLGQMKSVRNNYDSYWQEVADYTLPKRDFTVAAQRSAETYDCCVRFNGYSCDRAAFIWIAWYAYPAYK